MAIPTVRFVLFVDVYNRMNRLFNYRVTLNFLQTFKMDTLVLNTFDERCLLSLLSVCFKVYITNGTVNSLAIFAEATIIIFVIMVIRFFSYVTLVYKSHKHIPYP